jgi:hypothetical protein
VLVKSSSISWAKRFTVGIYNSYWSSFGDGERHALDLPDMACKANWEIYLISQYHFSLEELQMSSTFVLLA